MSWLIRLLFIDENKLIFNAKIEITLALPIKIKYLEKMMFDLEGKGKERNYRKVLRFRRLNCVFTLSSKNLNNFGYNFSF